MKENSQISKKIARSARKMVNFCLNIRKFLKKIFARYARNVVFLELGDKNFGLELLVPRNFGIYWFSSRVWAKLWSWAIKITES